MGQHKIGEIEKKIEENPATTKINAQRWVFAVIGILIVVLIIDSFFTITKEKKAPKKETLADREQSFDKRDIEEQVNISKLKKMIKEGKKKIIKKDGTQQVVVDLKTKFEEAKEAFYFKSKMDEMTSFSKKGIGTLKGGKNKHKKEDKNKAVASKSSDKLKNYLENYKKSINSPQGQSIESDGEDGNKKIRENESLIIDTFAGNPYDYLMPASTVINLSIMQTVMSDYEGRFRSILNNDVYDLNRSVVILPKGIDVLGQTKRSKEVNEIIQGRQLFVAEWAILPDGRQVRLTKIGSVVDSEGIAAIPGDTDYHWGWRLFGAGATALINTLGSYEGSGDNNDSSFAGDASSNVRSMTNREANKFMDLKPTVTVNFGDVMKFTTEMGARLPAWEIINDY